MTKPYMFVREFERGPIMAVYTNAVRFNKQAMILMKLPHPLAFEDHEGKLTATRTEPGFDVKMSGAWWAAVIFNRQLCKYLLHRYGQGLETLHFEVRGTFDKETFNLKPIQLWKQKEKKRQRTLWPASRWPRT